jgi:hypothetical protein
LEGVWNASACHSNVYAKTEVSVASALFDSRGRAWKFAGRAVLGILTLPSLLLGSIIHEVLASYALLR